MKKRIAVLMTVFNRKDKTLRSLTSIFNCTLPDNHELFVFLVNDGCTDGTEKEVNIQFPNVTVINSNGNLFWNRGMLLAWQTAVKHSDFDYYIWLNDDVSLNNDSIFELLNCSESKNDKAIISGSTCASYDENIITYGGRIRRVGIIKPNGKMQTCDCCNGQFCLIPRFVYQKMGMNDPIFHHGFGDWDYGFRAKKHGIDIFVAPKISGICDVNINDSFPKYLNSSFPLTERFKILYSPLGKNPIQFFIYTYRHKSLKSAIISFILTHVKVTMCNLKH